MTALRTDLPTTLSWMSAGTELLLTQVDQLSDADLAGPSRLPGWTRKHLTGHVARNAEALDRLLTWAQTGVETPMYASPAQRGSEIEQSSQLGAEQLRAELRETAEGLRKHAEQLTASDWTAEVRSAKGRAILGAEVPWMRSREMWLHALDLGGGLAVDALPVDFSTELVDDVVGVLDASRIVGLQLVSESGDHQWSLGASTASADLVVAGAAPQLAAWLTGRSDGADLTCAEALPVLPPWL